MAAPSQSRRAPSAPHRSTATAFDPDVLISDIGMPEVDGYDLIRHIRSLGPGEGGRTPAIALTAFAHGSDHREALRAGYDRHLAKPVDAVTLTRTVRDVLYARRV